MMTSKPRSNGTLAGQGLIALATLLALLTLTACGGGGAVSLYGGATQPNWDFLFRTWGFE